MNILIVEDEPLVADFLDRGLRAEGHATAIAATAEDGRARSLEGGFDVIILDVMLPDGDGIALCALLRGAGLTTPIIMLTARDEVADRVDGLRHGADDYLVKPYAFDELVARIDAITRRRRPDEPEPRRYAYRDIVFDRDAMAVTRGGAAIALTAKEFGILDLLMSRPGSVVSREHILSSVWNIEVDPLTNIVDVYIGRLRHKLESHGPRVIETVRGFGYRLC